MPSMPLRTFADALGVETNTAYLGRVLAHPGFRGGAVTTNFGRSLSQRTGRIAEREQATR